MKNLNLKTKPSSLFVKGITALSLSLLLQAKSCPGGTAGHMVKNMDSEQFHATIKNTKDISIFLDEKKRNMFYAVVKYGVLEKVKIILTCFAEDKILGFQHKNPDFLNASDPISKNTPLLESIEQGYMEIFKLLIDNKYIDINRDSNGITPLVATLKNKEEKMADELLSQPNIDIKAKDPSSGNRAIHFAIENKWEKITEKLINLLKIQDRGLLYEQNKQGNTPLHLAMQYKLPGVQSELIKLAFEDKKELWIKNKQDQTVIDVAIKYNQEKGISLIDELPIEVLCAKNKKDKTLLHKTAYSNNCHAFKLVLKRIIQLAGKEVVKQLFEKTKDGKTVWASIYLSKNGLQPIFSRTSIEMFKDTIEAVQDYLEPADRDTILEEINKRECTNNVQGGITKDYAYKLRNIVSAPAPAA